MEYNGFVGAHIIALLTISQYVKDFFTDIKLSYCWCMSNKSEYHNRDIVCCDPEK